MIEPEIYLDAGMHLAVKDDSIAVVSETPLERVG